jgi:hypothetical protein
MKTLTPRPLSHSAMSVPSEPQTSCSCPPPGATMIDAPVAFRRCQVDLYRWIVDVANRVDALAWLALGERWSPFVRTLRCGCSLRPQIDYLRLLRWTVRKEGNRQSVHII